MCVCVHVGRIPELVALWFSFLFVSLFPFFFSSLQDPVIATVIHPPLYPETGCSNMCFSGCGGSVTHAEWKPEVDESWKKGNSAYYNPATPCYPPNTRQPHQNCHTKEVRIIEELLQVCTKDFAEIGRIRTHLYLS